MGQEQSLPCLSAKTAMALIFLCVLLSFKCCQEHKIVFMYTVSYKDLGLFLQLRLQKLIMTLNNQYKKYYPPQKKVDPDCFI